MEWVLGVTFWNAVARVPEQNAAIVKLPNANQMKFHELYEPTARGYLEDLINSLESHNIQLTMSNPDFVCVANLPEDVMSHFREPLVMGGTSADTIDQAYQNLIGQCDASSILFALTVKTSVRPDRRYQIVHEANVVKTLVAHLAGRSWDRDLYTAFYAMIGNKVSESDREVLRNPATYSLVQVSWTPGPLGR